MLPSTACPAILIGILNTNRVTGNTLGMEGHNESKTCGLDPAYEPVFCLTRAVFKNFDQVAYGKNQTSGFS